MQAFTLPLDNRAIPVLDVRETQVEYGLPMALDRRCALKNRILLCDAMVEGLQAPQGECMLANRSAWGQVGILIGLIAAEVMWLPDRQWFPR